MKKGLIIFGVMISCSTFLNAAEFTNAGTFSTDTRTITLSTSPATGTRIFNAESQIQGSWVVNPSTVNVFVSTFTNANITSSTIGVFTIPPTPANGVAVPYSFNGPVASFNGPLFGWSNPGGSQISISALRIK